LEKLTLKKNKNEFLATNSISMVPVGFVCSIYVITIVSKTKKAIPWTARSYACGQKN